MIRILLASVTVSLLAAAAGAAGAAGAAENRPAVKNYQWGKPLPEQIEIATLTSDIERGKEAFQGCRGCHKPDAGGILDGTYPRLSGQHASVVIKQVIEVRAGIRSNPKMEPFSSKHALTLQEIADIAVFIESVESNRENGKGSGTALTRGKQLYASGKCALCHGEYGEGIASQAYPVVASQHFGYLVRELEHIQKGTRGNSHPDMVKAIRSYSRQDMEAVADYMSRMPDHRTVAQARPK